MKAYKNLSSELTNTYKKVYLYYGKEFPRINTNNIFYNELVAHEWFRDYNFHETATFKYNSKINSNIFKDDFIEWIETND